MKRVYLLFAMAAGLTACSSENTDSNKGDSTELIAEDTTFTATNPPAANSTDCYQYVNNKDSVVLKLKVAGEEVTGDLNYNWFEKDKNKGTLAGEMKGDTLIAEYLFDSEGTRSVRDVVFLKKGGQLYEGYGKSTEKGGKMTFEDRSKLKFDAIVLSKVPCN